MYYRRTPGAIASSYRMQPYELPKLDQILADFLQAGGSMRQLLENQVEAEADRKLVGIQILNALGMFPEYLEQFELIRKNGEAVDAMLAEDDLAITAKTLGDKDRIQAIKVLLQKRNIGTGEATKDKLDELLEVLGGGGAASVADKQRKTRKS